MTFRVLTCLLLCNLICSLNLNFTGADTNLKTLTMDGCVNKDVNIEHYNSKVVGKWVTVPDEDGNDGETSYSLFSLEMNPPTGAMWAVKDTQTKMLKNLIAVGKSERCAAYFPFTVHLYVGQPLNHEAVLDLDVDQSLEKIAEMIAEDKANEVTWFEDYDSKYQFGKLQMTEIEIIEWLSITTLIFGNMNVLGKITHDEIEAEVEDEERLFKVGLHERDATIDMIIKQDLGMMNQKRIMDAFATEVHKYIDFDTKLAVVEKIELFETASAQVIEFLKADSTGFYDNFAQNAMTIQNEGLYSMQLDTMNMIFTSVATALQDGDGSIQEDSENEHFFANDAFEKMMIKSALVNAKRTNLVGYDDLSEEIMNIHRALFDLVQSEIPGLVDEVKESICKNATLFQMDFLIQKLMTLVGQPLKDFKADVVTYLNMTQLLEDDNDSKIILVTNDGKIIKEKVLELLAMMGMGREDTRTGQVDMKSFVSMERRRQLLVL